ncbi:MAG: hypothetical protein ACUVQG_03255 [Thermogutta sp.]
MSCKHLQELYQLCQRYNLKLTGPELVRIVCPTCGVDEICPNVLIDEYDRRHTEVSLANPDMPKETGTPQERPEPRMDSV